MIRTASPVLPGNGDGNVNMAEDQVYAGGPVVGLTGETCA